MRKTNSNREAQSGAWVGGMLLLAAAGAQAQDVCVDLPGASAFDPPVVAAPVRVSGFGQSPLSPEMASTPAGDGVVVYVDSAQEPPVLRAQRFVAAQGSGLALALPAVTPAAPQTEPVANVAMAADGAVAIVHGDAAVPLAPTVRLYRFDAVAELRLGDPIAVPHSSGNHEGPDVAMDLSGAHVVAWSARDTELPGGEGFDVYFRRFSAQGQPLDATDVRANLSTAGAQGVVAVARSPADGRFVLAWFSSNAGQVDVLARLFSSDGAPLSAEILVAADVGADQSLELDVAMDASGAFIVAYTQEMPLEQKTLAPRTERSAVHYLRFAPDGSPRDQARSPLATPVFSGTSRPRVSMDAFGQFSIAWRAGATNPAYRRFDADGSPLDAEDRSPRLPNGGFVGNADVLYTGLAIAHDVDGDLGLVIEAELFGEPQLRYDYLPSARPRDLALSIQDLPDPVAVGQRMEYLLRVDNQASPQAPFGLQALDAAVDDTPCVRVRSLLPAQGQFDGAELPEGWLQLGSGSGRRTYGPAQVFGPKLPAGAQRSLSLGLIATQTPQSITASASVLSSEPDPSMANNGVEESTQVINPAGVLRIELLEASFGVQENVGSVSVQVLRTGGTEGAVSVRLRTVETTVPAQQNRRARAGEDFLGVDTVLQFTDGDAGPRTLSVGIVDDTIFEELDEFFLLQLSEATGGALIDASGGESAISILDDDAPEDTARWSAESAFNPHSILESDGGTLFVRVERNGFDFGREVRVWVAGGTATEGEDFELQDAFGSAVPPEQGTVYGFGESDSLTARLRPLDDLFAEGVETVILELLAVEGENAIPIGSPARLTLTLNDDAGDNQTPPPPPAVVAREDVFSLNKGVLDAPLDVLANDRINRGPARIVSVTQPLGGSVRIDADQAGLLYTAECGFAGSAGFSYTVEADSEQATAEVSLNLEVGPPAEGLPGDVDTRFGCAGFLRESAGVRQGESLLLDDGRLLLSQTVLVGEPARQRIELAMFDGFGSPDLTFGSAGRVLLPESIQGFSLAFASRLQQQGAFLLLASPSNIAAGSSMTQSLALLRVDLSDGALDLGFGVNGLFRLAGSSIGGTVASSSGIESIAPLVLDESGRILLGGNGRGPALVGGRFFLCRLSADGVLDTGFAAADADGLDGCLVDRDTQIDTLFEAARGLIARGSQPLLGGQGLDGPSFVALTESGLLDPGFGQGGRARFNRNSFGEGSVLGVQSLQQRPDGRLLAALASGGGFEVLQLLADGQLDVTFAGNGLMAQDGSTGLDFPLGQPATRMQQALLQADGRVLLLGEKIDPVTGMNQAVLGRLLADGTADTGFKSASVLLGAPGDTAGPRQLHLAADGGILLSGAQSGRYASRLLGGDSGDAQADALSFPTQTVPRDSLVVSAVQLLSGLQTPTLVRVQGGEYSLNCGAATPVFESRMGLAQAGDSICLRHRSAAVDGGQVLTSLRLGAAEEEVLASFRSVVGAVVVSPTAVATPTAAPTPSVEPSPTGTPPSITPSATPVSTPTTIPSLRPSPTPTLLPGPTASPSPTPSITPVLNLPPQAADDVFELELFLVEGDNTARLDVLANDRDPEGASLRIVSVEQALSGLVDIIEEGAALRFTAATATIRELNLAYVLSDGQNTARAEVQLRIASPSFAVLPAVMVDALQDSVGTNGAAILLSCVTRTDSIEQPADAILDLEAVPAVRLFEAGVNFSRLPQRFLVRAVPSAATVAEPICVQLLYELQGVDPEAGDQGRREIPWFNAGGLQSPAQSFEPLVDPQTLLRLPRFDAPELSRNGFEQQIVAENSGEAVVRIQPGEDREQPLRVRLRSLRFAPGYQPPGAPGAAATAGQDYQPVDVELFWEAGDAEARTLRLPLSTEDGLEGEEFLVLAITEIHFAAPGVEASASVGPQSVLALSLRDADTLRFDPAVCFVEEGGSQQVLLTRDMVVGGPLQVRLFDQAMGGAQRGLDYPAVDRLLQFAAGQSEIALSVSALEDALLEGEESFALDVEVPAGQPAVVAGANDRGRFIFNIIDKGLVTTPTPTAAPTATPGPRATPTPTVTPSATPIPAPPTVRILPEQPRAIAEGQSLSYLLQLSAPSAQAVAVRLALTGGLDASDVQFSPPTVVFSPGELQKTVQVLALFSPENEGTESGQIILLADNAVAENAVTLLISEAGGAVASPTPRPSPTASPTPGPTPALPVAVISGPERVQRTAELLFDASSSVPVRGRFLAQYRWTLRKADDGTELDRQLSGSPIFRVRAEQLGKLLLELQVVDIGSFVSEPRQLQIEVVPEEDSLRLFFENGVATAREGGEIRLRVERIVPSAGNSAPPIPLSARLLRLGGTAGAEEIQIDGAELRWEANDRSPRTVFVRPLEDAEVESTETLSLGLEEVVGVRSSSPKQLLAQIGDNSPRSTVQFGSTLVNLARPQGQGATLLLPVQRTGSLEQALDVRIGFAPSAVAECVEATGGNSRSTPNGLDFDDRDTVLRLPARVASATLRVSVLPGDRSFAVPNAPCEGFAVRLLDDAAYDLGAGQQAQINLRDGEVVIRPIETDILVKEDAGRAILRLEALANQSFSGDVRLRSINSEKDSARPGVDFELLDERLGLSASALPFRAEATASLKLINNAVADGTRSLLLAVEDPQFSPLNASVDTPRDNSNPLRVTIIDDEEVIEIIPPKPGVPKLILTGGKLKTPLLPKAGEDGRVELLIEPALERADAAVLLQIDLTTEPQAAAYALCDALACVENNTAYIDPDSRLLHILLSDGGAGDLDGEVNGEIRHLGQLLQISAEGLVEPLPLVGSAEPSPSPAPSAPPSRRQGSGAMGLGWLLLLLLWRGYGHSGCVTILRAVRRRRWRPNVPCSMVSATRRYWS